MFLMVFGFFQGQYRAADDADIPSIRTISVRFVSVQNIPTSRIGIKYGLSCESSRAHKAGKLLADGAYDSKAEWNRYSGMGIEVVFNVRSGQLGEYDGSRNKGKSNGCAERGNQIKKIKSIGKDRWKLEVGYGRRWKAECTFSDLKRLFGDILRARKRESCIPETVWKANVLNIYKACRRQAIGA